MTAYELYREARLDEAIEVALARVKAQPTDLDARLLLCDLLCFDSQLQRADRQLDVIREQDPALAGGVGLYRQLIRAEIARGEVFDAGRAPEFLDGITDTLQLHLAASAALRESRADDATSLLQQAEEHRSSVRGECDGESFEDLRDLDDLSAAFLEVLTSTGKYYWIGWEQIQRLEFRPPKYCRDLLWRETEMVVRNRPEALVYVPVLYPGSGRNRDPQLQLGRKTEWIESFGGVTRGIGQRTLLVGDRDKSILSIASISFLPEGAQSTSAA
jgi:type VI secretion system protein ImpE